MTRRHTATLTFLAVAAVAVAACSNTVDVATERVDQIGSAGADLPAPAPPTTEPAAERADPEPEFPSGSESEAPADGPIVWTSCDVFGIPADGDLGTSGWECGTLAVPMDVLGEHHDLEPVTLALTRHAATGERIGSLLVNPGGPGASGLEAVWAIRPDFPADVLRAYDVVGWDPRGVGSSTPRISCGEHPDLGDPLIMQDCARETGDLAGHVSAYSSVADMESIRRALGDDQLDYLGYSYGTNLGAMYAYLYPDRVGSFVLDGAIDPLAGSSDGVYVDGFPFYAADGTERAAARFTDLCDATDACLPGAGSATAAIDSLRDVVGDLPTDDFPRRPQVIDADTFDGILESALYSLHDWPLVATALDDGRTGDASTLAGLAADDPAIETDPDATASPFEVANIVIYCADFQQVIVDWEFCDYLPQNSLGITPVLPVDVEQPILVIGTEYDPAAPGRHAAEYAAALGDATHVIWDGVGHTVFPGLNRCVDDIVAAHLVDGLEPVDGTRCPFVDGISDDAVLADQLFAIDQSSASWALSGELVDDPRVDGRDLECVVDVLAREDRRTVTHLLLGVESADAAGAIAEAVASC